VILPFMAAPPDAAPPARREDRIRDGPGVHRPERGHVHVAAEAYRHPNKIRFSCDPEQAHRSGDTDAHQDGPRRPVVGFLGHDHVAGEHLVLLS
jgi:hypothetical protein